ncbi:hypothetical protein KBY57_13635 [Cyanobium sp. Aljojuca 7D2]|nr:hypothetical protein [Cyanobium sp. Aljojuca 7D2]MCP9892086.1 hypothetical protein [Cyanobium sp. Aljojuca 7D2]
MPLAAPDLMRLQPLAASLVVLSAAGLWLAWPRPIASPPPCPSPPCVC